MIYGFARQSGGQVRIYTEVGMGTTMCIYLPRHVAENSVVEVGAELDEKILSALNRPSAVGRVLVVDDEPTVRMLVVEVTGTRLRCDRSD